MERNDRIKRATLKAIRFDVFMRQRVSLYSTIDIQASIKWAVSLLPHDLSKMRFVRDQLPMRP